MARAGAIIEHSRFRANRIGLVATLESTTLTALLPLLARQCGSGERLLAVCETRRVFEECPALNLVALSAEVTTSMIKVGLGFGCLKAPGR